MPESISEHTTPRAKAATNPAANSAVRTSPFLTVLEYCMAIGLLIMAGTVVLQVILSSCFHSQITGANELISKLFVYVTAVGAAVAVGKNEHIAITFVTESLPPTAQRWLNSLALISVALINAVVVTYSFHWISVTGDYLIPPTPLPRIVAQLAIPIGSGLAILFCVTRLFSQDDTAGEVAGAAETKDARRQP